MKGRTEQFFKLLGVILERLIDEAMRPLGHVLRLLRDYQNPQRVDINVEVFCRDWTKSDRTARREDLHYIIMYVPSVGSSRSGTAVWYRSSLIRGGR